jgi:hypothetical protein
MSGFFWYTAFLGILIAAWYDQVYLGSSHTHSHKFVKKLTSLEWLALHSCIAYILISVIYALKPNWFKVKTVSVAYLGTLSLAIQAFLWNGLVSYSKESEDIENIEKLGGMSILSKIVIEGGIPVILVLDGALMNRKYERLSGKLLMVFDIYMAGWYGMIQNFCRNATRGYSYEIIDTLDSNYKYGLLALMALSGFLIKLGANSLLSPSPRLT